MSSDKYILVEGLDGSGKTTLAESLATKDWGENTPAREWDSEGRHIQRVLSYIREPDSSVSPATYAKIRQILATGQGQEALLGLFLANRIAMQESWKDTKASGLSEVRISDRSFISTIAYQGMKYPVSMLKELHRDLPTAPTHVVYLQIDPRVALSRLESRGIPLESYETLDKLTAIQGLYESALEITRELYPDVQILRIDADQSPQQVFAETTRKLKERWVL